MERLSEENESTVRRFAEWLKNIDGPDDIFPPDTDGCRELSPQPRPKLPALAIELGELAICGCS